MAVGNKHDTELDQSLNRIGVASCCVLYMVIAFSFDGYTRYELETIAFVLLVLCNAVGIFLLIRRFPGRYVSRRLTTNILDIGSITFFLYRGEFTSSILFPFYLWVTLGNGFRFGKKYLFFSQALSLLGLFVLTQTTSFWARTDALPLCITTLIFIPLYATTLIGKLVNAVSDAEAAHKEMEKQAKHDPLTGLPNRRYLSDWLHSTIAHRSRTNESVAALYIDLDGFSEINNQFGHEAGDAALLKACAAFKDNLRESDFLARVGGDEFILINCGYTLAQLKLLSQRLIDILSNTAPLEGLPKGALGASIGIAMFPDHAIDADELIRKADAAMYEAKNAGRRCYRVAKNEIGHWNERQATEIPQA